MPNFDKNILIGNIKRLMKEKDITQPKLAEDLHIGQPSISKYLNGKQAISIDVAYSLAQYFGVTLDDLCKDKNQPNEDVSNADTTPELHQNHMEFLKACAGLADVFKYSLVSASKVERQEAVYEEEIASNGYVTGLFTRKKGPVGGDPFVKYNSIFFPKYHEIETQFSNREEFDEYMSELRYVGNSLGWNMRINDFLDKLIDLNTIYQNGSITKDAYFHAIDSNLEKVME